MKNVCLTLAAVAGLVAATTVFADNAQLKQYYSSQKPLATADGSKANRFPPTDITITNSSVAAIHVVIPGTSIHDTLYPTANDHIRNNNGAFNTSIILEDPYHTIFWNNTVCPRALVTVYGQPGSYRINVDNEYCY